MPDVSAADGVAAARVPWSARGRYDVIAASPLIPFAIPRAMPLAQSLYRVAGDSDLLWKQWDYDEVLVFHSASGRTHLLDALSAEVLKRIESGPLAMTDLLEAVRRQYGIEVEDLSKRLLDVCQSLSAMGLIDES